jgi:hypothetical protein
LIQNEAKNTMHMPFNHAFAIALAVLITTLATLPQAAA